MHSVSGKGEVLSLLLLERIPAEAQVPDHRTKRVAFFNGSCLSFLIASIVILPQS